MIATLSMVFTTLAFAVGLIFFIMGLAELKKTFQEKDAASPTMGFIYFLIGVAVYFPLSLWWFASVDDPVTVNWGWLWFGFGWLSFALALTCIVFVFKASANKSKDGGLSIGFNEGAPT